MNQKKNAPNPSFPLIIIFLGLIVISMPLQNAYAAVPTLGATSSTGVVAGGSAAVNDIVVVFSESVNATSADTAALWGVTGFTVASVTALTAGDCGGLTTLTITVNEDIPTGDTPLVTYTRIGVLDPPKITSCSTVEAMANGTTITPVDGLSPTFVSAATPTSTTITVTYSESVVTAGVVNGDYTIGGVASAPTVTGIAGSGTTTLTLTLDSAMADSDTPTVTYTQTGGALEDAALNDVATHAGSAVTNTVAPAPSGQGSGCSGDCEAPTLGLDSEYNRKVTDGFSYNGIPTDVERFYTPYPLITVNVGETNQAVFKIYENYGPQNVKHFSLAFGLGSGEIISLSKAMIELDIDFDGTETVTITDPENALENVIVKTSTGDCNGDSVIECLIVTIDHTFRAPLEFNMVGTDVWDDRRNSWQNYYNHGIEVVGESLNPPNEYFGIYKGKLIHLIETAKNTAIDADGNTWTFDKTWKMDYIPKGKIDDPISSQGYDRNHVRFDTYKQGQELIALSLLEQICLECFDKPFEEINDIFDYEFPVTIDREFDPVLLLQMHEEDIRAQKYLEEMFAKIYPSLAFEQYPN